MAVQSGAEFERKVMSEQRSVEHAAHALDAEEIGAEAQRRSRGGRPTRAAAAERDERLLDIAGAMFMEHGFDATSMERLAEAASVGKATLYARYADKGALFAAVLRRRILEIYEPLEEQLATQQDGVPLEELLRRVAKGFMEKGLSPGASKLSRILAAQAPNFPDLGRLAMQEGYGRRLRLVETILTRFATDGRYDIGDPALAADLFIALVFGRNSHLLIYGIEPDRDELARRTEAAIGLFMRGIASR